MIVRSSGVLVERISRTRMQVGPAGSAEAVVARAGSMMLNARAICAAKAKRLVIGQAPFTRCHADYTQYALLRCPEKGCGRLSRTAAPVSTNRPRRLRRTRGRKITT